MNDNPVLVGPIYNFLDLLAEWDYTLPKTTQWMVAIVPECVDNGSTYSSFFNMIGSYTEIDFTGFRISSNIMNKLLNNTVQPNTDGIGLYYAQSVSMPGESFSIASAGSSNAGGFLKGMVAQERMDTASRILGIEFLETNIDFVDGLIRPWVIAASHRGLINLGKSNSIKSNIYITQMTNSASSKNRKPIRKIHIYTGCLPISVPETDLTYDTEKIVTKKVDFSYINYTYKMFTGNE